MPKLISERVFGEGKVAALAASLGGKPFDNINAPLRVVSNLRNTPLIEASRNCRTKMVAYLLAHGASINAVNRSGYNAVTALCYTHIERPDDLLMNHGRCLDALLAHGAYVGGGLEHVCMSGCIDCVQKLIKHGADVNAQDSSGQMTPLMQILKQRRYNNLNFHTLCRVVRLLLTAGSDVNLKNLSGMNALMYAAEFGYELFVRDILNHASFVQLDESEWRSALHLAVRARNDAFQNQVDHVKCIALLLQHGAPVNARNGRGRTVLMEAAFRINLEALRQLLDGGADANVADHFGHTALIDLMLGDPTNYPANCHESRALCATLLLDSGVDVDHAIGAVPHREDVDYEYTHGSTALMRAMHKASAEVITLLLGHGASVNKTDARGRTALHMLTCGCLLSSDHAEEVADMLLNAGANINVQDNDGTTALMRACQTYEYIEPSMSKYVGHLLKRGAVVNLKSGDQQTALSLHLQAQADLINEFVDDAQCSVVAQLLLYGADLQGLQIDLRGTPSIDV